ncbi:MAG: transcriptional repressor [Muribaculum sp.]|nr:transcriptional repressor [Muribaculum sp.]
MEDICNANHDEMTEEELLEHAGVRPTAMRLLIYKMLNHSTNPLSSLDMEMGLETADRSTISRTLATFLEHDLVHAIDDGSGSVKYEACRSPQHHHSINDLHVHFHCTVCNKTFCLHEPVPNVSLPEGFVAESLNYVISGKCDKCAAKGG